MIETEPLYVQCLKEITLTALTNIVETRDAKRDNNIKICVLIYYLFQISSPKSNLLKCTYQILMCSSYD